MEPGMDASILAAAPETVEVLRRQAGQQVADQVEKGH
jgi:hypothetical protein